MDEFNALRPYLFSIAYRILGSAMDAEDVVQDAYLRWAGADRAAVRSPKAFLATVVTRLCINRLTAARAERESYVGVWLPEPLLTAADPLWSSPEAEVGGKESLSMAFMLLLEALTPDERAVFVLRAVFDYDYADIASAIGKKAAACRQLYHRARGKVADARHVETSVSAVTQTAEALTAAFVRGDMAALSELLTEDVVAIGDGGGKVRGAGTRPVHGPAAVATVMRVVFERGAAMGMKTEITEVNGALGFVARVGDAVIAAGAVELRDGKISRVLYVLNPDKLERLHSFID